MRDALPQTDEIAGQVGAAAGTVGNILLRSTLGIVGGAVSVLLLLLLLIFVLMIPQPLVAGYLALAPGSLPRTGASHAHAHDASNASVARSINGCIIGLSIGVGLQLIGMPLALMFGAFTFLENFCRTSARFSFRFRFCFSHSIHGATKFWLALAIILIVYQIELNLLVPVVLGREMRLHPVVILFFTLAMGILFGLLGAILALPAAALSQILIDEFYLRPRRVNHAEINREATTLLRGKK